jgi:hypothetical protein
MEPLGGERHRWESREVEMLGRHESMRATSEFSTRSTSKPQPIGHTIKIAPHCRIVCVRPHGFSQNRPTIIGLSSSLALYCRLCQPHCCSPRRSCSNAGPPMPLATRGSIVSRQLPLCSTATSRLYRPCRSPPVAPFSLLLLSLYLLCRASRGAPFFLFTSHFPRYVFCLVPASRLSSGRSSINSSAGTV